MTTDYQRHASLQEVDAEIFQAIGLEQHRQEQHIELIASENYTSKAVMEAQGSVLTNKYAEGYPGKRYYGGCEHIDTLEQIALDRAKELFGCRYANVQPHSGAQANTAALLAFAKPGDVILGMGLDQGGHLTHGSPVNISGKLFQPVHYGLDTQGVLDYEQVETLAKEHRPKVLIGGFSAYSGIVDWARLRRIADSVEACFMVDMAHVAGLVAGGVYPSPVPYAHVVTTTTHKSLRGPRGGLILSDEDDPKLHRKLGSAVFPCVQGGPLEHVIAGKAVCFREALTEDFRAYAQAVVDNATALAERVKQRGLQIVSGGTSNHLFMIDLRSAGIDGATAQDLLESAHITLNKNAIPNDPAPPQRPSGIRLGTPAMTTRGFGVKEAAQIGDWLADLLTAPETEREKVADRVRGEVAQLCTSHPVY